MHFISAKLLPRDFFMKWKKKMSQRIQYVSDEIASQDLKIVHVFVPGQYTP